MKPGGRYVAKDMFEVGGIPLLMKTLLDHGYLHGDCMTVTGRTIAENLKSVKWNPDQDVVRSAAEPLTKTGGVVGLKGNLAPDGAIVKVAGMANQKFTGPARCFDGEEACFEAVRLKKYKEGEVLVIRYEGPRGGPGMREMLSTTAALYGQGMGDKVALDHRRPVLRRHPRLLRRPCRPGGSGRRSDRTGEGRRHHRDRRRQRHDQRSSLRRRNSPSARAQWKPRESEATSGYLWKYAQQVGPRRRRRRSPIRAARPRKHCYAE